MLDIVENWLKINFLNISQNPKVPQISHSVFDEQEIISKEIKSLLKGRKEASMESGDFISTVFTCRKEGGTFRFTLNFKHLNDFIANKYLKMKSI